MANVTIKLTDAQKAKIKEATGQDHSEVRMGFPGSNPPVSAPTASSPLRDRQVDSRRQGDACRQVDARWPSP